MASLDHQPETPDWDLEQLEVILEEPTSWQVVIAGPGAGKSAVACQRVAYLVDEGVPPSRILLVSFTRTAVSELRDRIVSYAVVGDRARTVRISTVDSHAWSLRVGFDDRPLPKTLGTGSYDLSIQQTIELFRNKNRELLEFMARLEHLIIDEAQDILGARADLILEMLQSLSPNCGVTILADPAQAIYGFTSDGRDSGNLEPSLLLRLPTDSPRPLQQKALRNIHRIKDAALADLFLRTRKEIELAQNPRGHVARVQETIRQTCGGEVGITSYESLADFLTQKRDSSMLVLLRRRADVLLASSYCSNAGIEHRLRVSGMPVVVRPWLGWLFGETVQALLSREDFEQLWEVRASLAPEPFSGEERDACWLLLHRLAAGTHSNTLDLVHLRSIVARPRPPIELCCPELGSTGPILGTIHSSKGREADTVVLVMPPPQDSPSGGSDDNSAAVLEEGRVYYVGATRARKMLLAARSIAKPVSYLDSSRIFRRLDNHRAQLEIGRAGDVDMFAQLAWSDAKGIQQVLAAHVGRTACIKARMMPDEDFAVRLSLEPKHADGITRPVDVGRLGPGFDRDLGKLWSMMDPKRELRPAPSIPHLYLIAVSTIGVPENERGSLKPPYRQSALALAPVVKGFSVIPFLYRSRRPRRHH